MASIIENIFGGNGVSKPTDETMVYSLMAGAAAAATAYLTATLDSTTPEVKRLLNDYTNQVILGHEALTTLAINKGWYLPYEAPIKQLQISLENSQEIMGGMPQ
ncbi:MAG: spore coat protein [Bacillota bacterium]